MATNNLTGQYQVEKIGSYGLGFSGHAPFPLAPPLSGLGQDGGRVVGDGARLVETELLGVLHAVGALDGLGHAVVRAVEGYLADVGAALDARGLLEAGAEVGVDGAEDRDHARDDALVLDRAPVADDIVDVARLLLVVEDVAPESAGLVEVLLAQDREPADRLGNEVAVGLVQVDRTRAALNRVDRREVIAAGTLVEVSHRAVTLEVAVLVLGRRLVDWQLHEVGTDTVAGSVVVREETRLQDGVLGGLDSWNHVGGRERDLLDLGEVVVDVLVQRHLADLAQRVVLVRPDVGQVEDVDALLLPSLTRLLLGHDLDLQSPSGVVTLLDRLEQVVLHEVVRLLGSLVGVGLVLLALIREHVELGIDPLLLVVDELDGVAEVRVHEAGAVGDAAVAEHVNDLVNALGVLGQVVPVQGCVVRVVLVRLRVALLRVDEVRELGRVTDEEDRGVVAHEVPVTLVRAELDREATGVAQVVARAALASDGAHTARNRALGAFLEDTGDTQVLEAVGALELAVGASALGVHDTLGHTLAVEVSEKV